MGAWSARSVAATTTGGLLAGTSVMVTVIWSELVALRASVAVSVKVMVVLESTWGAVNEGDRVAVSARVMLRAESCDHR